MIADILAILPGYSAKDWYLSPAVVSLKSAKDEVVVTKKMSASALVKKMPRETLESILLEHIGEDATLERHIIIEYGTSTTEAHYRALVDGMLGGLGGWGYGDYMEGEAYDIAREIDEMFAKAKKNSGNEQANAVFAIAQAVVEGVVPRLSECDDHDGSLYGIIDEALKHVEAVAQAKTTSSTLLEKIALWAEAIVSSGQISGWSDGWEEQCAIILAATARSKAQVREVLAFYGSLIDKVDEDAAVAAASHRASSDYFIRRIMLVTISLLGKIGAKAERAAFIEAHLDIDDVRELAIREAFTAKDFQRCKVLALKGISLAEKNNLSGFVDGYRQSLIEAMDALGAGKDSDALVEKWTIEAWRDTWFKLLKSRTRKEAWEETRERVLVALESKGKWTTLLASLYDSERLYDRLMTFCEKDREVFVTYYKKLLKKFPKRVASCLLAFIRRKASYDSMRSSYQGTATLVADYCICAGVDAATSLIDELEAQYRTRRAMRDELEKVRPVRQTTAAKDKPLLKDLF